MNLPIARHRSLPFGIIRRLLYIAVFMLAGALLASCLAGVLYLDSQQDLSVWHTAFLDEEFTANSDIKTFKEYLAMEDRLFAQLDEKVYSAIEPAERKPVNRYSRGSLCDPARWPTNWNHTIELTAPQPVAGVLLLHGLSDAPYSLHSIGQQLNASGAYVLGLRIPGHGTVPSGLIHTTWEDMAAAVQLAVKHLKEVVGDRPLYLIGYSNGGALAINYVFTSLEDDTSSRVAGVVLISPEIGLSKAAALAVWQARLGRLLGMPKLAWNSVLPEFDPYKYNSFAINAGDQAYRLTGEIQRQLTQCAKNGLLEQMPPILAFQSMADSTVLAPALIENLLDRLPTGGHELVMFDTNRMKTISATIDNRPRAQLIALLDRTDLAYGVTLISNVSPSSLDVAAYQKRPGRAEKSVTPLSMTWPTDLYSLSHVALPFSSKDPLYGCCPETSGPGVQLGNVVLRGENGLLKINPAMLLRIRWNPFYDYLEQRVLGFIDLTPES